MTALALAPIVVTGFAIEASLEGDRILVRLSGTADMGAVEGLGRYLPGVHEEARRHAVKRAEVDLRQLEFMSSACFKGFITWLLRLEEMPDAERYRVHFISNPAFHWQRRSLHALRSLAQDVVTIEA